MFRLTLHRRHLIARILITGASGFVGRHILQTLMQFEHPELQIVAATPHPENLPAEYRGEVRVGDLRDEAYLDRVLTGIDSICHAAGFTNYSQDENLSRKNYLEPTIELINRAREWRVSRFVNLSSVTVSDVARRPDDDAIGRPRRGCAMYNCLIAVEDYLKTLTQNSMSVINLRAGIYSGRHLHHGLLPLLLQRPALPLLSGRYGHLPLVDGRDIGQAFARAALLPDIHGYVSLNITGPESPSHHEVVHFIQEKLGSPLHTRFWPANISRPVHGLLNLLTRHRAIPATTCSITSSLCNPPLTSLRARQLLGYQPLVHWRASLEDFLFEFRKGKTGAALCAEDPQAPV